MALKLDITDKKGVKTCYYKIKSFEADGAKVTITLRSYVNQTTRDAEKSVDESNKLYVDYLKATDELRAEMDNLSAQLSSGDNSVKDQVVALTEQYNERISANDRPQYQDPIDCYYSETTAEVAYIEPLTLDSLYTLLASDGKYKGAETI